MWAKDLKGLPNGKVYLKKSTESPVQIHLIQKMSQTSATKNRNFRCHECGLLETRIPFELWLSKASLIRARFVLWDSVYFPSQILTVLTPFAELKLCALSDVAYLDIKTSALTLPNHVLPSSGCKHWYVTRLDDLMARLRRDRSCPHGPARTDTGHTR